MTSWDGKDRRKLSSEDHDMLTRVDANLTNLVNTFMNHIASDEKKFSDIHQRLKILERAYYIAVGVIIVVQFLTRR